MGESREKPRIFLEWMLSKEIRRHLLLASFLINSVVIGLSMPFDDDLPGQLLDAALLLMLFMAFSFFYLWNAPFPMVNSYKPDSPPAEVILRLFLVLFIFLA